jgi:hypothetical protein
MSKKNVNSSEKGSKKPLIPVKKGQNVKKTVNSSVKGSKSIRKCENCGFVVKKSSEVHLKSCIFIEKSRKMSKKLLISVKKGQNQSELGGGKK